MSAGAAAATVAVIAAKQREDLYDAFRAARATSEPNATSIAELELDNPPFLREALRSGAIVRAGEDRYYLNESIVNAHSRASGAVILIALTIVAGLIAVRLLSG